MFRQCCNTGVTAAGTVSLTLLVTGLREDQQAAKLTADSDGSLAALLIAQYREGCAQIGSQNS